MKYLQKKNKREMQILYIEEKGWEEMQRKGMEIMIKKRVLCGSLLVTASILFAGRSNAIPEMDDETKALVVEYTAGIVEKYDQNRVVKLKEVSEIESAEKEESTEAINDAEQEVAEPSGTDAVDLPSASETESGDTNENTGNVSVEGEAVNAVPASLEEFLQTEGISFRYEGYETASCYPNEQSDEELYFVMNATEGNRLLILHFTVNNDSQEDKQVDLMHSGTRFKIEVNGEIKNALTTMLLNDLCNYQNMLAAGESDSLVLVCEVSEEQADSIQSLSLTMRNADNTSAISLN